MNEIKTLLSLMDRRGRVRFLWLTVLVCLTGPFEVLGLGAIVGFLQVIARPEIITQNEYTSRAYDFFGFSSELEFISFAGLAMVLVVAFSNGLMALVHVLSLRLTWGEHRKLSVKLMTLYLERDYLWYLGRNTADLSKTVLNEVQEAIREVISPTISLVNNGFRIIIIGIFLVSLNYKVAAIALVGGGLGFWGIFWATQQRLRVLGKVRLESMRAMYQMAGEMFGGIKEVKLFGAESHLLGKFESRVIKFGSTQRAKSALSDLPRYLIQTITLSGIAFLAVYLFRSGYRDSEVFSTLALFAVGGYRLVGAAQRAFASYSSMRFAGATLQNLEDDLSYIVPFRADDRQLSFSSSLALRDVTFTYPEQSKPVLDRISLQISPLSKVALVGSTGSGKTTLVSLILGLLQPESGTIEVDGQSLCAEVLSAWRQKIGYVPQDIFLLDDTVLKNIAFAVPEGEINIEAARRAATIAQLDQFVQNELPEGYDTLIGERGARISGGQRQRLGLARALYRDPDILVLDEATSALDGQTESAIVEALETLSSQKTIIVIAHRLQTIERCDTIYVLRDGQIVGQGTYAELAKNSDEFKALAGLGDDGGGGIGAELTTVPGQSAGI